MRLCECIFSEEWLLSWARRCFFISINKWLLNEKWTSAEVWMRSWVHVILIIINALIKSYVSIARAFYCTTFLSINELCNVIGGFLEVFTNYHIHFTNAMKFRIQEQIYSIYFSSSLVNTEGPKPNNSPNYSKNTLECHLLPSVDGEISFWAMISFWVTHYFG